MTTVSQLSGITPPVMMRTACPGPTVPQNGLPANEAPTTPSVTAASAFKSAKRIA
jgi:hypothetical protein